MAKYVVNLRSGVVHKKPTREQCNMDQAARTKLIEPRGALALVYDKRCRHCFAK